jgi:hypothetical protein
LPLTSSSGLGGVPRNFSPHRGRSAERSPARFSRLGGVRQNRPNRQ